MSPEEIREWSRDEKFANNNRLLRMLEQLKEDTHFDESKASSAQNSITRSQLNWFLNSLNQADFEYLAKSVSWVVIVQALLPAIVSPRSYASCVVSQILTDQIMRINAIVKEVFGACAVGFWNVLLLCCLRWLGA